MRRCAPDHSAWALPPSPYGHRKPPLPPQASATVKSNCVECVGIKYPIIQHRHAIKRAAVIIGSRHRVSPVTITPHSRRLPLFFLFLRGRIKHRQTLQRPTHFLSPICCTHSFTQTYINHKHIYLYVYVYVERVIVCYYNFPCPYWLWSDLFLDRLHWKKWWTKSTVLDLDTVLGK